MGPVGLGIPRLDVLQPSVPQTVWRGGQAPGAWDGRKGRERAPQRDQEQKRPDNERGLKSRETEMQMERERREEEVRLKRREGKRQEKGKLETWEDKRAGKETVRGEKIGMNRVEETW